MTTDLEQAKLVSRREAIRRVSALLGGVAFVGGSGLLTACEKARPPVAINPGKFSAEDVAYLDEIAETILPATKTPGAKAAKTGAFMALMVTDSYGPEEQKVFRAGMQRVEDECMKANKVGFMAATPQQRTALLTTLDHEQKADMDAREAAERKKKGLAPMPVDGGQPGEAKADAFLPDERKENATGAGAAGATAITTQPPPHFFRMMKELALLGFFTSEIGYTKVMRYAEAPGRFDPCIPYTAGEPAWAPHA